MQEDHMGFLKRLDDRAGLMNRMAETVGADIGDAIIDGRLDAIGVRSALIACAGCGSAEECVHWMDAHPDGAQHAPDYCRNATLLDRLAV